MSTHTPTRSLCFYGAALTCAVVVATAPSRASVVASTSGGVAQPAELSDEPTPVFADAVDRLRTRAQGEAQRPVPAAAIELLSRIDPTRAKPSGTVGAASASEPLEQAMQRLALVVSDVFGDDAVERAPVFDPLLGGNATTLVEAGRASLARGDVDRATAQFVAATEAKPDAAIAWLGLGDAQAAKGLAALARRSYAKAILHGDRSPHALLSVGVAELRSGSTERAAAVLAALVTESSWATMDRSAQTIAWVTLGEALLERGSMAAGAEAIERGLSLAHIPDPESPWAREAAGVLRRSGELQGRVRNAWRASGAPERARAAETDNAIAVPRLDAGSFEDNAITHLLEGYPAAGALALIEGLAESDAWIDERTLVLVGAVAAYDDRGLGTDVSAALLGLLGVFQPTDPRALAAFQRAAALADPDPSARVEHFAAAYKSIPSPDLLRSFVWAAWNEAQDSEQVTHQLTAVVAEHPFQAELAAEVLTEFGIPLADVSKVLDRLVTKQTPGANLLANALDRTRGLVSRREADGQFARLALNADLWQRAPIGVRWLYKVRSAQPPVTPEQTRWYARALMSIRDEGGAADLLVGLCEAPRFSELISCEQVELLLESAEASARAGRFGPARDLLERVAELSPSEPRAAFGLLTLASRNTPGIEVALVLRRLRAGDPASVLLQQLAARDLLRKGLLADAEALLSELGTVAPDRILPASGVRAAVAEAASIATIPRAFDRVDDANTLSTRSPVQWLDLWRASAPEHVELFSQWATVASADGVNDDEAAIARAVLDRVPHPLAVSSAIALLAWTQPDRESAFGRLLIQHRLGAGPDVLDVDVLDTWRGEAPDLRGVVEVVLALLQADRTDVAARVLGWLPVNAPFTPDERTQFENILRIAYLPERDDSDPDLHMLFDAMQRLGVEWDAGFHEVRLRGLVSAAAAPDRLLDAALYVPESQGTGAAPGVAYAARQLFDLDVERLDAFMTEVVRRLNAEPEPAGNAPGAVAAEFNMPEQLPPGAALLWLMHGVNSTDRDIIDSAWAAIVSHTQPQELARAFTLQSVRFDGTPERVHAELAYQVASLFIGNGDTDLGEEFYLRALQLDPEHPWTGNDYGYLLLERGGHLEEADRLISIAARALPDNANVLDSLGWVRYARGIFRDRPADQDGPALEGAVTLLLRAVRAEDGGTNPVIIDHLGDALWRIGDKGEAVRRWREAGDTARNELRRMQIEDDVPVTIVRSYSDVRERVREKISEATRDGGEPPVAPVQSQTPQSHSP